MNSQSLSNKEIFLKFMEPRCHQKELKFCEEWDSHKDKVEEEIQKLVELEFYQKASDNLKNAIKLRTRKDTKTFFYRQLQNLNDKIVVFKNMQERYKTEKCNKTDKSQSNCSRLQRRLTKLHNLIIDAKPIKRKNYKKKVTYKVGSTRNCKSISRLNLSSCASSKKSITRKFQISTAISETSNDHSPVCKPRRKLNKESICKSPGRLPNLKLQFERSPPSKGFKRCVQDVGRIVSVIDAIGVASKNRVSKISLRNFKIGSKRNEFKITPNEEQRIQSSLKERKIKSISPAWKRLSIPRYISPDVKKIQALNDHLEEEGLPQIDQKRREIKCSKPNRSKINNSRTRLIYQNSVKSLRSLQISPKATIKFQKNICKPAEKFSMSNLDLQTRITQKLHGRNSPNENFSGAINRTVVLQKRPVIEGVQKLSPKEIL
ncbi:unnamed protein product [Moneuplotes crassus]|uniref:Uncharacterized protein n=1 Tax=Euplotes crassus TaxID=5936 RepID=A0AAD1U660_EUPCR|nr:unnamed protein product [Moneuplotes crassus]